MRRGVGLTSGEGGNDSHDSLLDVGNQGLDGLQSRGEGRDVNARQRGGEGAGDGSGALGSLEGTSDALQARDDGGDNADGGVTLNSRDCK
jgi:hypothetical protein